MTALSVAENIARVRERIVQAARRAGRPEDAITLIAVSKTRGAEAIAAAYEAGQRDFGENYVQEALAKVGQPPLDWPDVRWHFIGHLQSNKVKDTAGRFALIHSVDSVVLAQRLGNRAQRTGAVQEILLEVRLDEGAPKFGFSLTSVLEEAAKIQELPGIRLRGLMGMAPFSPEPEAARPYFRRLHEIFARLPAETQQHLSMGMTGDFEVAIEEGATLVRIGTAIFGPRPPRTS